MIRVLIVDDQRVIREGLKLLLKSEADIEVVGTAEDGQSAIEQVEALKPDMVIIDMEMPGVDGATATKAITEKFEDVKIVVLSAYDRQEYVTKSLTAGARGYLIKNSPAKEIAEAIRSVNKGYVHISSEPWQKIISLVPESKSIVKIETDSNNNVVTAVAPYPSPEILEKPSLWRRLLVGAGFIGISLGAITVGTIAVGYRMSNLAVENGVINGRLVSVKAPINGILEDFYPRPGGFVNSDQILARIQPTEEAEPMLEKIRQLEAEIESKTKTIEKR